jgi:hypothetical protein
LFLFLKGGDVARADDLNYFLVGSMSRNMRMANETTLVSFYLEALVAAVADEYKARIPFRE